MADIREALHTWYADHNLVELAASRQKALGWDLMRLDMAEDKLAGILMFQEILLPRGHLVCAEDLPMLAGMFDDGHIYDWSTCDWLCVRVLGPLAEAQGEECARAIAAWRTADNLWRRRAAGVAFVNLARRERELFEGFRQMLVEVCTATVAHPERFAQTGTGWVLRELSKADEGMVVGFIENHHAQMSREGVRYATAKLADPERERLLALHTGR